MLIDWFTVIAQILNFLVLVWLLKKFLYKPVLKAIEHREEKIRSQLQEADAKMERAEEEKKAFRQKNEDFAETADARLDEMNEEVSRSRKKLLEEARAEAAALRMKLIESVREEKEARSREISQRMQEEIFAISRKVLRDLASADLEREVVRTFVKRIEEMKEPDRDKLTQALNHPQETVVVHSAFELPEAQQQEIETAIADLAGQEVSCRFATTPAKVLGLEVTAGSYKIAWSVAEYLHSLENVLSEILHEEGHETTQVKAKAAVDESSEG